MRRPRALTALALAAGSVAGAVLFRRRGSRRREHVDLYFADGSMVSLGREAPEAEGMLEIARRTLRSTPPA